MKAVTPKRNGSIDFNGRRVATDILGFFSSQIELEKGYTLRSFFQMLDQYKLLINLNDFNTDLEMSTALIGKLRNSSICCNLYGQMRRI